MVSIFAIVGLLVSLYFLFTYFGASNSPVFSENNYLELLKNPQSKFLLKDLGKSQLIIDSLERYFKYFKLAPYSLQAQGIDDIARGVIFLPILSFLVIYIFPPIVVAYIGWFVYTYFKYVIEALWGWFLMIYNYGTKLIECQLANKWYIRMVTGWHKCSPEFAVYFDNWKRQYVDVPIYYETLKYVDEYHKFKEKYFSEPKFLYIDKNIQKLQIAKDFSQKTFIQRAMENFIYKFNVFKYNVYDSPKNRFFKFILEYNYNYNYNKNKQNDTDNISCNAFVHGIPNSSNSLICPL